MYDVDDLAKIIGLRARQTASENWECNNLKAAPCDFVPVYSAENEYHSVINNASRISAVISNMFPRVKVEKAERVSKSPLEHTSSLNNLRMHGMLYQNIISRMRQFTAN